MTAEGSMEDANLTVADVQGLVVSWNDPSTLVTPGLGGCSRLLCLVQIPPTWQKPHGELGLKNWMGV